MYRGDKLPQRNNRQLKFYCGTPWLMMHARRSNSFRSIIGFVWGRWWVFSTMTFDITVNTITMVKYHIG